MRAEKGNYQRTKSGEIVLHPVVHLTRLVLRLVPQVVALLVPITIKEKDKKLKARNKKNEEIRRPDMNNVKIETVTSLRRNLR